MPAPPKPELPAFGAELAVIGLGGAIGASLRFAISLAIRAADLPVTFAAASVNLIGSFLLGLMIGHLDSERAHPLLRPFLTLGVFGSFTTFSALALDNRTIALEAGEIWAASHLAGSIAMGLAAFVFGNSVSERGHERGRA